MIAVFRGENPDEWFQHLYAQLGDVLATMLQPWKSGVRHKIHLSPAVEGMMRKMMVDTRHMAKEVETARHVQQKYG